MHFIMTNECGNVRWIFYEPVTTMLLANEGKKGKRKDKTAIPKG